MNDIDKLAAEAAKELLETQKRNPAWSKAELWGIERDIIPEARRIIKSACEKATKQAWQEHDDVVTALTIANQTIKS